MSELKKAFYEDKNVDTNSFEDTSSESYKRKIRAMSKSPEEKTYILMLVSETNEELDHKWISCIGRTEAYETSVTYAGDIDLLQSFVLVEGNTLENSVSMYKFLKHMSTNIFTNSNFNVDDWIKGDVIEDNDNMSSIPNKVEDSDQVNIVYDPERKEESIDV